MEQCDCRSLLDAILETRCFDISQHRTFSSKAETIQFLSYLLCNAPGINSRVVLLKSAQYLKDLNVSDWKNVVAGFKKLGRAPFGHYVLAHFFLGDTIRDYKFLCDIDIDFRNVTHDPDETDYRAFCQRQKELNWGEHRDRIYSREYAALGLRSEDLEIVENLGGSLSDD